MADYAQQSNAALQEVLRTGKLVEHKGSTEAALAIIIAATEEVKKITDPTSAVGRIMLATFLEDAAWKLGNSHTAFHQIREAAVKLNPRK